MWCSPAAVRFKSAFAALIWGPVALDFLATGAVGTGLLIVAFGVLVIGLVDNLLRPFLVGKDTRLPDYLVLISTVGGMSLFGLGAAFWGLALGLLTQFALSFRKMPI